MADTQKTAIGAPVVTHSYAPNNGLFNCFDDTNSCLLGLFCEPINLGMLANKTNTGNMFAVCYLSTILCSVWMLSGIPCHACYAPDVINTAVAKYGVTEEVECCPVYYCCGPCSTCRAHREVDARIKLGVTPVGSQITIAQPVVMTAPTPVFANK
jgi:Cys-rich protein (TIGR01571 family)